MLASTADEEIDRSDIPEITDDQFRRAVRGGFEPKSAHTIKLMLSPEVADWLEQNAVRKAHLINFALKQVVQHSRRASRERAGASTRPVYDRNSAEFRRGLDLLSGREAPTTDLPDLPEFSDDELAAFGLGRCISLQAREITLWIDDEVWGWLQEHALTYTRRVQFALDRLMQMTRSRETQTAFDKAS